MRYVLLALLLLGPIAEASKRVRSYTTRRGTRVESHRRSSADGRRSNNWSSKGSSNPYTGKRGSKRAWK